MIGSFKKNWLLKQLFGKGYLKEFKQGSKMKSQWSLLYEYPVARKWKINATLPLVEVKNERKGTL